MGTVAYMTETKPSTMKSIKLMLLPPKIFIFRDSCENIYRSSSVLDCAIMKWRSFFL